MFNTTNSMTPADIAAITGNNNNDGWGANSGWFWIIILIILFGGWGYGNGNGFIGGNSGGAAEGYVLASDFSNLSRQMDQGIDSLRQQGTALANGISSLGYDQLNQFNNINTNVGNTGQNILNALNNNNINAMQNTNTVTGQLTALGTQLAQCCCDQRYESATQFANLNYNLADQSCQTRRTITDSTNAITLNQDANTRSILEAIKDMQTAALQDKIATLQADNQTLKFAASQAAQNDYIIRALQPVPVPAYPAQNLYGGTLFNTCNCNAGCGC